MSGYGWTDLIVTDFAERGNTTNQEEEMNINKGETEVK